MTLAKKSHAKSAQKQVVAAAKKPSLVTALFGTVKLDSEGAYVKNKRVVVNGHKQSTSLFVGEGVAENPKLQVAAIRQLDGLSELDTQARSRFSIAKGEELKLIKAFVDVHLSEMDADIQKALFGKLKPASLSHPEMLKLLKIRSVGLHVEGGKLTTTLDYSFGNASDELLVARFEGHKISVSHES
jgi:hypothetical protein